MKIRNIHKVTMCGTPPAGSSIPRLSTMEIFVVNARNGSAALEFATGLVETVGLIVPESCLKYLPEGSKEDENGEFYSRATPYLVALTNEQTIPRSAEVFEAPERLQ